MSSVNPIETCPWKKNGMCSWLEEGLSAAARRVSIVCTPDDEKDFILYRFPVDLPQQGIVYEAGRERGTATPEELGQSTCPAVNLLTPDIRRASLSELAFAA